ncbi:hypothetical protein V5799_004451 [Amblyomma americanum]|uniref:Amino acid transporter transmembrane domain-containing protein n=1 Tax=Amblyomma americanum TaxID=6943 RepID=A0AAQ4D627_AMBAM
MAGTASERGMPAEVSRVSGTSRSASKMTNPTPPKDVTQAAPPPENTEGVGTMTAYSVAVVMATSALGAGLLHFPAAYNVAGGILMATVVQLVLVVALGGTILTLAFCADVNNDGTYHDILLSMCGVKWRYAAAVSVLLTCYGVCVTYLIVIGDQYDRSIQALRVKMRAAAMRYISACLHFQHPGHSGCSVPLRLDVRRVFHGAAPEGFLRQGLVGAQRAFVGIAHTLFFLLLRERVLAPHGVFFYRRPESLFDVLLSTPVFCFAYQSHEVVIPAYAAMRERSLWNMAKAIAYCMVILMVAYSMVGCFGYLSYGSTVRPDVMEMFDATKAWVLVGLVALIFKMAVTYPLPALCARSRSQP